MTHEPVGVSVIPLRNEPERSAGRSFSGDDRDTRHRASAHIEQVEAFLQGTVAVGFSPPPESERYAWISRTLSQFAHHGCDRRQRGLLRRFIARVTGYSRAQLIRLIAKHRAHHLLGGSTRSARRSLYQALWRCCPTLPDRNRPCPQHLVRSRHQEARRTGRLGAWARPIRGLLLANALIWRAQRWCRVGRLGRMD